MKRTLTKMTMLSLLIVAAIGCKEDEVVSIDPMIEGVTSNLDMQIQVMTNSGSWSGSLIGLRDQRFKLVTIKSLIDNGGYNTDTYKLGNPTAAGQRVQGSITRVESVMDSVWQVNVADPFEVVDPAKAGIVAFGSAKHVEVGAAISTINDWLYTKGEASYTANDILTLQTDIGVLDGLANLNEVEVQQFVTDIENDFATLEADYASLANEVASAPEFSKAQKDLYAALDARITEMEQTIENELSLETRVQLDLVRRDMEGLTYFVANNYTSPAQAPVVYGEIASITELRWLSEVATADDLNGDWVLTADIDAAETARWNLADPDQRYGFRPIITETSINFDGQFHIISGLHMAKIGGAEDENRSGLFAKVVNGSITNLGLINLRITAENAGNGNQGGSLVGWMSGSTNVTKCFTQGTYVGAKSQTGGFIGRPQSMTGEISDCFSVVATSQPVNAATSSFIGLPVAAVNLKNCYNLGVADPVPLMHSIFGHGSGIVLTASGIYWDSQTVGATDIEHHTAPYSGATPVKLSDPGVVTDLPTANWGDLANFSGWSADTWEIRTETQFDSSPRPYLKGFNYAGIADFIAVP